MKGRSGIFQRLLALALALLLGLVPLAGLAQVDGDLDILLHWGDGETAGAFRLGYAGFEDCYWAQVPQEALEDLTLEIGDPSGQYVSFSPGNGEMLNAIDAGSSLEGAYTEIQVYDAGGNFAGTVYLYVSTFTSDPQVGQPQPEETPEPVPEPVEPAQVIVHYVDESWNSIAPDGTEWVEEGTHPVYADTSRVPEYYELQGENSQNVTVNREGADPAEITFVFSYNPPPVEPAQVVVHYVDESWNSIAPDGTEWIEEGTHPVYADTSRVPEYYELQGENSQNVTVSREGADPAEITFVFSYNPPPVEPAQVVIHYVNDQGTQIADDDHQWIEEGTHPVYADTSRVPEYYELQGENSQNVTVNREGADPAEITFVFSYNPPPVEPAQVVVHYVDDQGTQIADDDHQWVEEGTHPVYADTSRVPEYYELQGENSQNVTVSREGADPAEITFVFSYNPPPVEPAQVVVHYVDETTGMPVATDTTVLCQPGQSTVIAAQPGDLLADYVLVGEEEVTVTVDEKGQADQSEVTFVYRLQEPEPTATPEPEPTVKPEPTATPEPEPTVKPEPTATPEPKPTKAPKATATPEPKPTKAPKATATPEPEPTVKPEPTATPEPKPTKAPKATATPEPKPTKAPKATATPEPKPTKAPKPQTPTTPSPVWVEISYVDEQGKKVAGSQQVECAYGDTPITAAPVDLPVEYQLQSAETVTVRVDEKGASPSEVVFVYRYAPEVAAPKVALVGVRYAKPNGESFYAYTETCQEGVENKITLDWKQVDPDWNYRLISPEEVRVTVDGSGVASPSEVVFQFALSENIAVSVYYRDLATGKDVATSQQIPCFVGNNHIQPHPDDLKPNYELTLGQEAGQNVVLTANGEMTPTEVVFQYVYLPTPSPAPATPVPPSYDIPMDAYGYPRGKSVNFRSSPTTAGNNVIGTVRSSDLAHIVGQVSNEKNEIWYAVEINGQAGYLNDSVLRILTDAEVAALFGYTMPPTSKPTAQPTPVPEDYPIDRWAQTNAKVNFRKTPETINSGKNGNKISELKKGTRVWVYSAVPDKEEGWYFVRVNGKDGYLMTKYVDVMSQKNSDQVQSSLATPMPTQVPPATPEPTERPTRRPTPTSTQLPVTDAPVALETPVPPPYRGYALTQSNTALRTGVSRTDDSILEMLPGNALVYVSGQTYVEGVAWSSVQAVNSGNYGFILDDQLFPISNEEAKLYLGALQPAATPEPTPVPEAEYGYAMTMGDNVPLRAFPDTNGQILDRLPYGAVASVQGQSFEGGEVWHVVLYNGQWGFIRADQLRMLDGAESEAYEQSLLEGTPAPAPEWTEPEPVTEQSLSSYGHVISNSGRVNLRAEPSTQAARVRLLNNYAFALVLGTVTNDEGTWYHVSQAGTEGYIAGNYFKVLSIGELSDFLQSDDYINANREGNSISGARSSDIQPVEDYNKAVWQNPALSPSYEPFNPYLTPTPDPERIVTATPALTPTAEPAVTIAPFAPTTELTPAPTIQQGGSPWPWVLLALAAVGGGGAYYAYTIKRKNERRRQAMRAQQARQARAAAQHPQTRAAQNNPTAARAGYTAPFMPPQGGAPRPTQQMTNGAGQNTAAYRPNTPAQPPRQGTQPFAPVQGSAPSAPVNQATQAFAPAPGKTPSAPNPQGTQAYTPVRGEQKSEGVQATQAFKPATGEGAAPQRRRRSDRHQGQEPGDDM